MMLPSVKIQVSAGGDTRKTSFLVRGSLLKSLVFGWICYLARYGPVYQRLAEDWARAHS